MPPRLQMLAIQKRYGATLALDGVSLSVMPGEVHALVGQNGAGKSTLMKTLSGAIQPDSGTMLLDGQPYAPQSPIEGRKRGVAMIYQELSLAPHLSVVENILLGMEPNTLGFLHWGEMKSRAKEALIALGHPHLDLMRPVAGLSPATQQIIEIARALAIGCRVLVLDEPTSSLTQKDVHAMFDVVRRLKAQGHAIVYISHFLEEVRTICDKFTILRDGKTYGGGDAPTTPAPKMVEMMVGRSVENLYPRSARTPGEVVLDIQNVSGKSKPTGATIGLRRGEVLGIAGLIGAGRTELLRAIFGLDKVTTGKIKVAALSGKQRSFASTSPKTMWDAGLGMLSEDRKTEGLALSMSIMDNLTLSDLTPFGPLGFIRKKLQRKAAQHWSKALAVKCHDVSQPIGDLSGGNQQKVAIARLLHHDVDILLLDEPTRGIDVGSKAAIYQLIDELAVGGQTSSFRTATVRERSSHASTTDQPLPYGRGSEKSGSDTSPKAVLVVSSYFPELLGICDRIAVMSRGVLGPARPVDQWTEHALVLAATGQDLLQPASESA